MVPRQSQSYTYISNAGVVVVTQGTPQWYPGNLKSYMYISNAGVVVVTQGTPQWYPGNLNPIRTLGMQESSLSPRVLPMVPRQSQSYMYINNAGVVVVTQGTPNGTQAISILYVH